MRVLNFRSEFEKLCPAFKSRFPLLPLTRLSPACELQAKPESEVPQPDGMEREKVSVKFTAEVVAEKAGVVPPRRRALRDAVETRAVATLRAVDMRDECEGKFWGTVFLYVRKR